MIDTTAGRRSSPRSTTSGAPMTSTVVRSMIQSTPYQVERLDWEGRGAFRDQNRARLLHTGCNRLHPLKILEEFEISRDAMPPRKPRREVHCGAWPGIKIRHYT